MAEDVNLNERTMLASKLEAEQQIISIQKPWYFKIPMFELEGILQCRADCRPYRCIKYMNQGKKVTDTLDDLKYYRIADFKDPNIGTKTLNGIKYLIEDAGLISLDILESKVLTDDEKLKELYRKGDEFFSSGYSNLKPKYGDIVPQLTLTENIKGMLANAKNINSILISFPENLNDVADLKVLESQGYKVELKITKPEQK